MLPAMQQLSPGVVVGTLLNDPALLIVDEPTVGLDPQMRREFHEHILGLKAQGLSVLITTHDMDEAAALCDRIAVIDGGKVLAVGTPSALIAGSKAMISCSQRPFFSRAAITRPKA